MTLELVNFGVVLYSVANQRQIALAPQSVYSHQLFLKPEYLRLSRDR
jgi:hypothetical protein